MSGLFLTTLVLIGAVALLIISGKLIVRSISVLARSLRISEYVISFVLLAFATSLPELSVGVNAAVAGVPELSLGDIIGTNIVNITLVVGMVALVGGTTSIRDYQHFKNNRLYQLTTVLAPLILLLDGELSRIDAVILLALFGWSIIRLLDIDDKILGRKILRPHLAAHARAAGTTGIKVLPYVGLLALGVTGLLFSTHSIIAIAESLATLAGMSQILIGIVIIAILTSLPELTIGVRSALRGKGGVTLGDVFGSATINSTLVLGVVALIQPITVEGTAFLLIAIITTIVIFSLVFLFLHTKQSLSRSEGVILLLCFVCFILAQIWLA